MWRSSPRCRAWYDSRTARVRKSTSSDRWSRRSGSCASGAPRSRSPRSAAGVDRRGAGRGRVFRMRRPVHNGGDERQEGQEAGKVTRMRPLSASAKTAGSEVACGDAGLVARELHARRAAIVASAVDRGTDRIGGYPRSCRVQVSLVKSPVDAPAKGRSPFPTALCVTLEFMRLTASPSESSAACLLAR